MKEEKILLLLKRKRSFLEIVLELTETETALALKEWVSVLEQKKALLNCVEHIDTQLSPYCASLVHLSQEVTDELESTRHIIQKILHLDTQNVESRKKELRVYGKKC